MHYFYVSLVADTRPLAEISGCNSVPQEEEVVPLRAAVVLSLGSPEEPAVASLIGIHLGSHIIPHELLVLIIVC